MIVHIRLDTGFQPRYTHQIGTIVPIEEVRQVADMDKSRDMGRIVANRRKALGVTQQDLAALAGVSTRFLSSLERGKATVRLNTMLAVLDALGLQLEIAIRERA
jgi:HTH-type transcriptional regulator / antitoxin HipB